MLEARNTTFFLSGGSSFEMIVLSPCSRVVCSDDLSKALDQAVEAKQATAALRLQLEGVQKEAVEANTRAEVAQAATVASNEKVAETQAETAAAKQATVAAEAATASANQKVAEAQEKFKGAQQCLAPKSKAPGASIGLQTLMLVIMLLVTAKSMAIVLSLPIIATAGLAIYLGLSCYQKDCKTEAFKVNQSQVSELLKANGGACQLSTPFSPIVEPVYRRSCLPGN